MIVRVENLIFVFESRIEPFQYERGGATVAGWPAGSKVVDVVGNEPPGPGAPDVLWLVEAKDYRVISCPPKPTNLAGLPETVVRKVQDTLAALPTIAGIETNCDAQAHAARACSRALTVPVEVVLHIEPHPPSGSHSALFPRAYVALIVARLRQLCYDLGYSSRVLDVARTPTAGVPWTVR